MTAAERATCTSCTRRLAIPRWKFYPLAGDAKIFEIQRDGMTDLYGILFKPTNFDPAKKYLIVNYIYPARKQAASAAGIFQRRVGTRKRLPSLDSLWFQSMVWVRRGAPSNFMTRTSEIWATTT